MTGMNEQAIKDAENLVLLVTGGIGRNISATAVVRNLKKAYPEKRIIVIAGSPDVFLRNPNVYRTYNLANTLYFYETFVKDSKSVFLNVEPYQHFDYLYKRKHFVECWCEMLGIPCDSVYPEIFFSADELALAENHVLGFEKEMVLCHFEGGPLPKNPSEKERIIAKAGMYRRSLNRKTQQKVVDELICRNYQVGLIAHENQFTPGCVERLWHPVRALIALIPYVKAVVCIDSFLMHGTAIFKKPSIVAWAGTSPQVLGYDFNVNLRREVCETPECHRPNSFLFDFDASGYQWDCPWNNKCCDYEWQTILDEFDKLTNNERGKDRTEKPPKITPVGANPYENRQPVIIDVPIGLDSVGKVCPDKKCEE